MEQRDLVIGAITNYNWDQIKYWVNSLDRSGFTGMKAVIAYNVDYATLRELEQRNYAVLCFDRDDVNGRVTYPQKDFAIVVDRFLHYYLMLDNADNRAAIRYVIATDVKDVVFQSNPSAFLDRSHRSCVDLVMSSEAIAYQHEPWGANNLLQSFGPFMYERHKENTIINCGVLAGKFDVFMGLCKSIYLLSHGTTQHVPGGGGPDQAALNLLLSTSIYDHVTDVCTHAEPWAAQLGTTMDPNKIGAYLPFITEALPRFDLDMETVVCPTGEAYAIVHQYDRVPAIKTAFERTYS